MEWFPKVMGVFGLWCIYGGVCVCSFRVIIGEEECIVDGVVVVKGAK